MLGVSEGSSNPRAQNELNEWMRINAHLILIKLTPYLNLSKVTLITKVELNAYRESFNARVTLFPPFLATKQKSLRGTTSKVHILTLPLTEEVVLHHSQLVPKEDKLSPPLRFCVNV